jgi:hypothetical protein
VRQADHDFLLDQDRQQQHGQRHDDRGGGERFAKQRGAAGDQFELIS